MGCLRAATQLVLPIDRQAAAICARLSAEPRCLSNDVRSLARIPPTILRRLGRDLVRRLRLLFAQHNARPNHSLPYFLSLCAKITVMLFSFSR
jgi:hypothetical protein